MQNHAGAELSLKEQNIKKIGRLLIDPDNVFWALEFDRGCNKAARKKILSLYNKRRKELDVSMRDFRFKTEFNSVYINPTDICNANCPYCYIPPLKRRSGKSLDNRKLLYILRKLDKFFAPYRKIRKTKPMIIYHASEPLLMKEAIFSSIEKFHKKFHFGIQTNAILLEKKDVEFLKSYKVSVGISLDSLDPKINDLTRKATGASNYGRGIQAIKWFDGYHGLNVITTVTKHNVKGLAGLVRFLHSNKVACVLLNPVRATRKAVIKLRPGTAELTKYFIEAVNAAIEVSKKSKRRIIIGNFSNIVLGISAPKARRLMCDISPCGGGRCFFAVTPDGSMIPCGEFVGLKKFCGGNIFKTSVKKAVFSKAFKKVRSRVVEDIPECDVCIYRNICGSPCPAELYSLSKDVKGVSPYCEFYKKIIEYAFVLIAESKTKHLFRKDALSGIKFEYNLNI